MRPTCRLCGRDKCEKNRDGWRTTCRRCRKQPGYERQILRDLSTRPMCQKCGKKACEANGKLKAGAVKYKPLCSICGSTRTKHIKETCERCGFVPEHHRQLHLDHIDGDRKNNDPSNYQTLCANCHALKTAQNYEYLPKHMREAMREAAMAGELH